MVKSIEMTFVYTRFFFFVNKMMFNTRYPRMKEKKKMFTLIYLCSYLKKVIFKKTKREIFEKRLSTPEGIRSAMSFKSSSTIRRKISPSLFILICRIYQ